MLYIYIMSVPYYNSNNFDSPNYLTDEDVIRQKTLNLIFNGLLFTAVICFMIILFPINPIYYGLAVAVEFIVIIMRFFVRSEENLEKLFYELEFNTMMSQIRKANDKKVKINSRKSKNYQTLDTLEEIESYFNSLKKSSM